MVMATVCKAVGDNGTIVSWNGARWSTDASGVTDYATAVSCVTTTFCKAVTLATAGNAVLSWNGASWSNEVSNTPQNLNGVICIPMHCAAVGDGGSILSDGIALLQPRVYLAKIVR
jgi:hypothetical protein